MRALPLIVVAMWLSLDAAAADVCEPHRAKYGIDHPLTLAGALALHAREARPADNDMLCLERLWTPNDGTLAASATRTLLIVIATHPMAAIEAATKRPRIYREWLADTARYGLHDVNGEAKLLRSGITQLIAAKPGNPQQEEARKLLLDALGAVQPFRF